MLMLKGAISLQLTVSKTSTQSLNVKLNKEGKTVVIVLASRNTVHFPVKFLSWIQNNTQRKGSAFKEKCEQQKELDHLRRFLEEEGLPIHAQSNNSSRGKSNVTALSSPCRTQYCLRFDALFIL